MMTAAFRTGWQRDHDQRVRPCFLSNSTSEIDDNIIAQLGETTGAGDVAGHGPRWYGRQSACRYDHQIELAYRCRLFGIIFLLSSKSHSNMIKENIFFHGPRAGSKFTLDLLKCEICDLISFVVLWGRCQ